MQPAKLPEAVFDRYRDLQRYVGWGDEDARRIAVLAPVLAPFFEALVEDFYAEIARHEAASKVITGGPRQIARLKKSLERWLTDLVGGRYDEAYVLRRWRVGWRHVEIGLDQVYTNAALSRLRAGLFEVLAGADLPPETVLAGTRSLGRLLDLDLAIIEDAYQTEHLARSLARDKHRSEAAFRALVETAPCMTLILEADDTIRYFSPYAEEVSGYRAAEVLGRSFPAVFGGAETVAEGAGTPFGHEPGSGRELALRARDGSRRWVVWSSRPLPDWGADGAVLAVGQDVTARREVDEQLRQMAKMEAVGRLAGGVAHDFNTLLGSILGYGELLLERLPAGSEERGPAEQIHRGAERGAALVRQLLAFSRRQVLEARVLDLNAVIEEMADMLHQLVDEGAGLVLDLEPGLGAVEADPSQLQQVVMNLVVNAADAVAAAGSGDSGEARGAITVSTRTLAHAEVPAAGRCVGRPGGRCVCLAVADTGCGMEPALAERIFEPFFTTKEPGKGTGLGLSTVYGIVRQSGGDIAVKTAPGAGSTFRIFLPQVESGSEAEPAPAPERKGESWLEAPASGTATVLLVEDDEMFRGLVSEVLTAQGFEVLTAADPAEALAVGKARTRALDLLISDLRMPGMSGRALARRLAEHHPETRVLLMSGASPEEVEGGEPERAAAFLQKPFDTRELVRKVRQLVGSAE